MATETIYASSHITGDVSTPANAVGAPDGTYTTDTGNTNWTSRWAMTDPSGALTSNTQTITVTLRKEAPGGTDPTLTSVTLYENGNEIQELVGSTTVTDSTTTVQGTFAGSAVTSGADVEIEIATAGSGGAPANRRSVQVDGITWNVDYSAATNATITNPTPATGTATAVAPTSVASSVDITATAANGTATAVAPTTVTAGASATVSTPTPATSTAAAVAPTSVASSVDITATAANGTAAAVAPTTVTAGASATVSTPTPASSTAAAVAPTSVTTTGAPTAPTNVVAKAGDRKAYVQWDTPTTGTPITSYNVEKNVNSGGWTSTSTSSSNWNLDYTSATDVEQWAFIDMSAHSNGDSVQFRVTATNANGTSSPSTASASVTLTERLYPDAVDTTNRLIEDQNGDPFFVIGDTAWSACVQLDRADWRQYIDDRVSRGANWVLINAYEHYFSSQTPAYENQYGDDPWSDTASNAFDPDTEVANYWTHIDYLIWYAEVVGITMQVCVPYIGYNNTEGWGAELAAATQADRRDHGTFLSDRYAGTTNIVWLIGHDRDPTSAEAQQMKDIYDGTTSDGVGSRRTGETTGQNQLITLGALYQTVAGSAAMSPYFTVHASWSRSDFDIEQGYGYGVHAGDYDGTDLAWGSLVSTNDAPAIAFEQRYEDQPGVNPTDSTLREQTWSGGFHSLSADSPMVAGGMSGAIFGNFPIWHFGDGFSGPDTDWQGALSDTGSVHNIGYVADLHGLLELNWWDLADGDSATFLTSGGSSPIHACRWAVGKGGQIYAINTTAVALDLTVLGTGTVTIKKYDPTDGALDSTIATDLSTSGQTNYTGLQSAGNNSAGDPDWLFEIVFTSSAVHATVSAPTPASSTAAAVAPTSVTAGVSATVSTPTPASSSAAATAPTTVEATTTVAAATASTAATATAPTRVKTTLEWSETVSETTGTEGGDATVTAPTPAAAAAVAATATVASSATVTATTATATATAAPVDSVTATTNATITATAATAAAAPTAPTRVKTTLEWSSTVSETTGVGDGSATVTAPTPAAATATAAPATSVTSSATVTATAAASAATAAPATSVTSSATVTATAAAATATSAPPSSVTAGASVDVTATAAAATATAAPPSSVQAGGSATVGEPTPAGAAATAVAPASVTAGTSADITATAAAAAATAAAPDSVTAGTSADITATAAAATATAAPVASITAGGSATITATSATATAAPAAPASVTAQQNVAVTATTAQAAAAAAQPDSVTSSTGADITATAAAAHSTATGPDSVSGGVGASIAPGAAQANTAAVPIAELTSSVAITCPAAFAAAVALAAAVRAYLAGQVTGTWSTATVTGDLVAATVASELVLDDTTGTLTAPSVTVGYRSATVTSEVTEQP